MIIGYGSKTCQVQEEWGATSYILERDDEKQQRQGEKIGGNKKH